ncbi:MAG: radical SAM/SPASM domain-containing protein [Desulfovibrio sp.]|uniref:radical SAM/SPASM domain-containing protein n=1 Tax=Desulfovibrio sp. 7SRBS1 TaxID=3378064 RepID=UPI003B3CE812
MHYIQNLKSINTNLSNAYAQANVPIVDTLPHHVTITTTLRCNYRCLMCYQNSFSGEIDWAAIRRLEKIMPFVRTLQVFGGEPLAYHRFGDLIKFSTAYGCSTSTITNGSLLTDDMIKLAVSNNFSAIRFSIDAGTPKTYKYIRGGDFFQVLDNVRRLSKEKILQHKHSPVIFFNFVAMACNIRELSKLVVISSKLGVHGIKVAFPLLKKEELLTECLYFHQEVSDEEMYKAKRIGESVGVHVDIPNLFSDPLPSEDEKRQQYFCSDPWSKLLINIDGTTSVCCGGLPPIGNLLEQDIDDFWNNDLIQGIRKTVNTPDEPIACKQCRVRKPSSHNLSMHIPPSLQEKALELHGHRIKAR